LQDPRLSDRSDRIYSSTGDSLGPEPGVPRSRVMRRRIAVFFGVFLVCAVASLAYTFVRPAVYLASARVQVTPQLKSPVNDIAAQQDSNQAFLVEMQVFSSRPLLEKVAARLKDRGQAIDAGVGDPVAALQNMLTVNPLGGTNVVQIEAQGAQRERVAPVVNTVIDVYREEQARAGETASAKMLADLREETRVMDTQVAERKKAVEAFRLRANIVSAERDENQVLARLKGMGTSLATANEREATAEGKLRAVEQAVAEGRLAQLSKDNPTVAGMEQRLSQWREEWRALERQFTPNYLGMDPDAKALKMRIDSLEQQLEVERGKAQQNAVSVAREELNSARAASRRLQQQLNEDKTSVQGFSRSFADFKTMQEELDGLEKLRQTARQKLLTLEASESTRKPWVQVVELATTPESAWRPLYARDAAISVVASLLLAFLAVWFVEFFNREEVVAGPSTVIIPQQWMPNPYQDASARLPHAGVAPPMLRQGPGGVAQAALPMPAQPLPRELMPAEVQQLLTAAAPEHQPMLACLLCGLSPAELQALRVGDADPAAHTLAVTGASRRVLQLPPAMLQALQRPANRPADGALFAGAHGEPLQTEDIEAVVTSSAHDAHLDQPHEVTPETLRHTYIAHLVRQGLRFGELNRVAGRLSAEALNALAALAPPSERVSLAAVDTVLPGVRGWADSATAAETSTEV
jgi:succinoglycan biosynthesis transport protein ExoP